MCNYDNRRTLCIWYTGFSLIHHSSQKLYATIRCPYMKSQHPAFMHFFILNSTVAISVFTQGMLLIIFLVLFLFKTDLKLLHAKELY